MERLIPGHHLLVVAPGGEQRLLFHDAQLLEEGLVSPTIGADVPRRTTATAAQGAGQLVLGLGAGRNAVCVTHPLERSGETRRLGFASRSSSDRIEQLPGPLMAAAELGIEL